MKAQLDTLQVFYKISKHITLTVKDPINVFRIDRICDLFRKFSEATINDPESFLEDLHDNYPQIIDCIFGGSGFVGLINCFEELKLDQKKHSAAIKVLDLFTPKGIFFDLVRLLFGENKSYLIPIESLPAALYSKSYPERQPKLAFFLKGKVFNHNSRKSLKLNAYEFYIYSCMTYPLRVEQETPPCGKKGSTIFRDFLVRLLEYFFPLDTSFFEKASQLKIYLNEGLSKESSSLPRFFLDLFFELWFNVDLIPSEDSAFLNHVQHGNIVPKAPGLELIKTICLHFQKGCQSFLNCADETSSKLLRNFWQSLQFEFQPRFFYFLKQVFIFQKFTLELLWAVDLWISYITPWKLSASQDFSQYSFFVVDNYLFYKELLFDFLYRCLESHFLAESLGRSSVLRLSEATLLNVLNIYNDNQVLAVLREADAALNTLTSRQVFLFSIDPDTSAACFSSNLSNSGHYLAIMEAHLKRIGDSPVFHNCLVTSPRTRSWKKDLYDVFSTLAKLLDLSAQANLNFSNFPDFPSHYYYELIIGSFNRLLFFLPGKRSLELAQSNYLSKHEYQSIANLIAKILNIPL